MADREPPSDDRRVRHGWLLPLAVAFAAVFVVRTGLDVVARVVDVVSSLVLLGSVAAVGHHLVVRSRRRRNRS